MKSVETIKTCYLRGADAIVDGQFPVDFDELPQRAYNPDQESRYLDHPHELVAHTYNLPQGYKHLAWWAFDAFCEKSEGSSETYFGSTSATLVGFAVLSRYLSHIVTVYENRQDKPHSREQQIAEITSLALRSSGELQHLAEQRMPVVGCIESNIGLRRNPLSMKEMRSDALHNYVLTDDDRVRARSPLDFQIKAVEASYLRNMEHDGEKPDKKLGCFALKVADDESMSVFFKTWHGIVLAGAKHPEIVDAQLQKLAALRADQPSMLQ